MAPSHLAALEELDRKRGVVCSLPATVEREGKLPYAA